MEDLFKLGFLELFKSQEFENIITDAVAKAIANKQPLSDPEPKFYTRYDAKRILRVSLPTIDKMIHNGELPAKQLGTRYLIPAESLEKALTTPRKYRRG